jgi:hypothetical protein
MIDGMHKPASFASLSGAASLARSAIMITGAFVFPEVRVGMIENRRNEGGGVIFR